MHRTKLWFNASEIRCPSHLYVSWLILLKLVQRPLYPCSHIGVRIVFFYHPRHSVVWCVYLNYEGISETQWASRTAYCCPCWILRRVIIYMAQNKRTKQGLEKKTTMVSRAEVSINDLRVFKPQTAWAKLYLEYIFSLCSLFITSFGFLSFFTLGTCCLCWQHSNKG